MFLNKVSGIEKAEAGIIHTLPQQPRVTRKVQSKDKTTAIQKAIHVNTVKIGNPRQNVPKSPLVRGSAMLHASVTISRTIEGNHQLEKQKNIKKFVKITFHYQLIDY